MIRRDYEQDQILASRARHLLVIAPPGTGKTFSAIRLAAQVANQIADHERVLVLTFSNQARAELHREARRLMAPAITHKVEIRNYHQLFREKVWAYRFALGLRQDLQLISEGERIAALNNGLRLRIGARDAHRWAELLEQLIPAFHVHGNLPPEVIERAAAVVIEQNQAGLVAFGDLSYHFWQLLERFPVLQRAAHAAYPMVIADEHQDASALQDAVVRRLSAVGRLVLFADDMQLIHGWRGADEGRLERHRAEADEVIELRTNHRWAEEREMGQWLLHVRARLRGAAGPVDGIRPETVEITTYPPGPHRVRGAFPHIAGAVSRAFAAGCHSVAVLCPWNLHVGQLRDYLTRRHMFPRQPGGTEDFEFARDVQLRLQAAADGGSSAKLALHVLESLAPQLAAGVRRQLGERIHRDGPRIERAGPLPRALLEAMRPLWQHERGIFFSVVTELVDALHGAGYHIPRVEAFNAIRQAARDRSDPVAAYQRALAASSFASSAQAPHGLLVMTVHQAKGKEFDGVLVTYVDREAFRDDFDGRRLLYVAMTRARRRLTLLIPQDRPSELAALL